MFEMRKWNRAGVRVPGSKVRVKVRVRVRVRIRVRFGPRLV